MEERKVNHIIKFTPSVYDHLILASKILKVSLSEVVEIALREYVANHKADLESAHAELLKNFAEE